MAHHECPGRLHIDIGRAAVVACTLGDHEEGHRNGSHHWYDDMVGAFCADCPEPTVTSGGSGPTSEPVDTPATVRVHPDDDPEDPDARRVILTNQGPHLAWVELTHEHDWNSDTDGRWPWPHQSLTDVARVLGHPMTSPRSSRHWKQYARELEARAKQAEAERDEWKQFRDADHFNAMEYLRRVDEMEDDRDHWKSYAENLGRDFRDYKIARPELEHERDAWQRRAEHAEDTRDKYATALDLIGHILRSVEKDTE